MSPDRSKSPRRLGDEERQPLLPSSPPPQGHEHSQQQTISFGPDDPDNPYAWSRARKATQVLQIFILALLSPAASSILDPAADAIAADLGADQGLVMASQAGFVCMLGVGPLFLAPMSETFGRRRLFVFCFGVFTLLQIPTALIRSAAGLVVLRTLSGFFGSVSVANGGGSISDLFETQERSQVLGVYLVAPVLGPTVGPLIGGLVVAHLSWRWIFWILLVASSLVTGMCYFFLHETRAVTILEDRKRRLQKKHPETEYTVEGCPPGSDSSILRKIAQNSTRAVRILTTQPIVFTMSVYQALIFTSMYSLYAEYSNIWSGSPYFFDQSQLGWAYLAPMLGFVLTSVFIVRYNNRLYNYLARRHGDDGQPEYRLPMANIGAVFLPASLFWFGWALQDQRAWQVPLAAMLLFGASQVSIFNTVQTYYIDAFADRAASALAAGAFLRSMVGGIVPLFVGGMFERLGYGVGFSVLGGLSLVLMPAPMLFYWKGGWLRERFPFRG
ncbi:hypothetical protein M406DRAFT_35096 [Cryphonectria parasitica EP155]|uniref:Major facilitator superfamily (MFS) profile domain-containing protein n=1 Tax=Cryphonectria parasitica (strain ATCC 38755 / EP155) TaxID=660469 RepID=A0A9P5CU60_CRYP1|nr:uncharacterized protein M406DRAFT_35096 [Cryphonectria parasitica EP155]KAF3771349.1 hypothetical protein M406DRAFT_35096 [Cryphonectria parasitica EP155]